MLTMIGNILVPKTPNFLKRFCLSVFLVGIVVTSWVLLSIPPKNDNYDKVVHVSIDDCFHCLEQLSSNNVQSIFDIALFKQIRVWNQLFGAKFTLYIFSKGKNFEIESIPERFRSEFADASGYLKFGFHSNTNDFKSTKLLNEAVFRRLFQSSNAAIDRFSGGGRSRILRLDRYFARAEWQPALKQEVDVLLAPDDDRPAYWLEQDVSTQIRMNGSYGSSDKEDSMILFWRTDLRYENIFWQWYELERLRDHDRIVIFTHEWAMDDSVKKKMNYSFQWFNNNGYRYVN